MRRSAHTSYPRGGALRLTSTREIDDHGGEFALNRINLEIVELCLVVIFGFLPLIVVHFSTRRFRFVIMPVPVKHSQLAWRVSALKTSLLVVLADWFSHII